MKNPKELAKTFGFSMRPSLREEFESVCEANGMTASKVLQLLLTNWIAKMQEGE